MITPVLYSMFFSVAFIKIIKINRQYNETEHLIVSTRPLRGCPTCENSVQQKRYRPHTVQ